MRAMHARAGCAVIWISLYRFIFYIKKYLILNFPPGKGAFQGVQWIVAAGKQRS